MTIEVELKFRLSDRTEIERKLLMLGAVAQPVQTQSDDYFQHPCRDFAKTDEALRVRDTGQTRVWCYKGPALSGPTKARRELELELAGNVTAEAMRELLGCLGFEYVLTVNKSRSPSELIWRGQRFQVSIDEVPVLGTFLELEILAEESEVSEARRAVSELAGHLQLERAVEETYLELLQATVALPVLAEKNSCEPA
ncbi:MAG: class IV adenylate cyclase [Planctomycetaceae bacterium]